MRECSPSGHILAERKKKYRMVKMCFSGLSLFLMQKCKTCLRCGRFSRPNSPTLCKQSIPTEVQPLSSMHIIVKLERNQD